jgi:hypothetical protein
MKRPTLFTPRECIPADVTTLLRGLADGADLRYHPLFPMVRQRRLRASFNSQCKLSKVKGLVVSRGPGSSVLDSERTWPSGINPELHIHFQIM